MKPLPHVVFSHMRGTTERLPSHFNIGAPIKARQLCDMCFVIYTDAHIT
jgi:hypothetical protein